MKVVPLGTDSGPRSLRVERCDPRKVPLLYQDLHYFIWSRSYVPFLPILTHNWLWLTLNYGDEVVVYPPDSDERSTRGLKVMKIKSRMKLLTVLFYIGC